MRKHRNLFICLVSIAIVAFFGLLFNLVSCAIPPDWDTLINNVPDTSYSMENILGIFKSIFEVNSYLKWLELVVFILAGTGAYLTKYL
jgi:hypothetical protein